MSINLDAIKARLTKVHAAGVSGVTVRLADYGLRVTVQMRSWDGTTAHDGYEAVTHLLGNAPADIGDKDKIAARTKEYEERFLSPFVAAERGYIDEVVMPHSTRRRIARALAMLRHKELENPWKKHDNIPL